MTSRLPKSSRVALSLTVAVTAMALGGSAYAQARQLNTRSTSPGGSLLNASPGGSIRNAPASDFTDQAASDNASAEPAADAAPAPSAPSAPSADDPQAEADEDETGIRRSRATYDSDPAEPE